MRPLAAVARARGLVRWRSTGDLHGFPVVSEHSLAMHFPEFFALATGHAPFPYQSRLALDGLPDTLEVPTGFGKTEAVVLAWLWRCCLAHEDIRRATPARLVYCLPMRVLVEQTEKRVRECLSRARKHGLTQLPEPDGDVHALLGGRVDRAWEGRVDRNSILIGTQDQLLSRALNRGYGMSRFMWPVHFALLGNDCHWIFDEIQLMGPGLSTSVQLQAFRERLGAVGPVRSTWMSATLDRTRLDTVDGRERSWTTLGLSEADRNHPQLAVRWGARKGLVRASAAVGDTKRQGKEVLEAHVADSLTLVVVNQVQRAQELFAALQRVAKDVPVRLVHSRFRPAERAAVQDEVLRAGWSGILVATQAIEAGVDLSARTLFTELAPWSSLVQRFGRLNRRGEHSDGVAVACWWNIPSSDEKATRPYEPEALASARAKLDALSQVGPADLDTLREEAGGPVLPVLRRRDLLQLFDTEPDLAGHDIDISPYVRASSESDVQVAWREWEGDAPPPDAPEPQRDELCAVRIKPLSDLLKGRGGAWRWSSMAGKWERVERLVPGMTVVVPREVGGYSTELGFTGDSKHRPPSREVVGPPPDADSSDAYSFRCDEFVTLRDHADDAAQAMAALRATLARLDVPWERLVNAARWHDLGKAHDAFQAMLLEPLDPGDARRDSGPWAKSDHRSGRCARVGFRHELASALALLQSGGPDLEVYLVAAHHGKVRLSLRARPNEPQPDGERLFALGVWDGDVLPRVDLGAGVVVPSQSLSLEPMKLGDGPTGPSWAHRTTRLLEQFGPFRLAFLEALVRIADWRATAKRQVNAAREEVLHG